MEYAVMAVSREQFDSMRADQPDLIGVPAYFVRNLDGSIETWPLPDLTSMRLIDTDAQGLGRVSVLVADAPAPVEIPIRSGPIYDLYEKRIFDFVGTFSRAVKEATDYMMSRSNANPLIDPPRRIVSMVEFNGRLFVATEDGVFVKRDDDTFVQLEIETLPAAERKPFLWESQGFGKEQDEAAGLRPLPTGPEPLAEPFKPAKFGEHGGR